MVALFSGVACCKLTPQNTELMIDDREQRFVSRRRDFSEPIRAMHEAALYNAGFIEVGPIWQRFDNCVMLGCSWP